MQDFQGFARMLRGSSGIKEFASGLQNQLVLPLIFLHSLMFFQLTHADTKLVRTQVFMSGNDITPFT